MAQSAARRVASVVRYNPAVSAHTISRHEPEVLLTVVDANDNKRSGVRQRDQGGGCKIEIDVLEHHDATCSERPQHLQHIKDARSDDVQGSYVVIERFPVDACKNLPLTMESKVAPRKSVLKKQAEPPDFIPGPVSRLTIYDEHVLVRGSRKGMNLSDPATFNDRTPVSRSTVDTVALLPKLGCSEPSFVARMERNCNKRNRDTDKQEETAHPVVTAKRTDPNIFVATVDAAKHPFDPCMDPSAPIVNKKSRPFPNNPQSTPSYAVFVSKTDGVKSPFDQSIQQQSPSERLDIHPVTSNTRSKIIYSTRLDQPSEVDNSKAQLSQTVTSGSITQVPSSNLVHRDIHGKKVPKGVMPFNTPNNQQSVYSVVTKASRVSKRAEFKTDSQPLTIVTENDTGKKPSMFSVKAVTRHAFKDPCFKSVSRTRNHPTSDAGTGMVVMAATVKQPVFPFDQPNMEKGTMTSNINCCPPACNTLMMTKAMPLEVIGSPNDNFMEESASDDELSVVGSRHTIATVATAVSEAEFYEEAAPEQKQSFFKRVFLCGACAKKQPRPTSEAPRRQSVAASVYQEEVKVKADRNPSGYVSVGQRPSRVSTAAPSTTRSRRPTTTTHRSTGGTLGSPSLAKGSVHHPSASATQKSTPRRQSTATHHRPSSTTGTHRTSNVPSGTVQRPALNSSYPSSVSTQVMSTKYSTTVAPTKQSQVA